MKAQDAKGSHAHQSSTIVTNLFDLVTAMQEVGATEQESVATLTRILASGRVSFCSPDSRGRRFLSVAH
jgi:hypothetical protein